MKELSSQQLLKRRNILLKKLSKIGTYGIRGSIVERYKRCGKKGCACAKGRGHGPKYYISVSRKEEHPAMHYIPQSRKRKIEVAVGNYRLARAILEEISEINRELFLRREF